MSIELLRNRDVQPQLIETWGNDGVSTLTDCQAQVFSHEPLWEGKNVLVVAPTSSGKTFIGEVLAAQAAFSLRRAIFLVPFKALAEEKFAEFKERYDPLGISVVISDGDHTRSDHDIRRGDFGIAVIVYEKLAQLIVQSPGIWEECALLVVDEVQLIGDRHRGPSLEILLTQVLKSPQQPQIIGLSATMSELGGLDAWLEADVVTCESRPVPLFESVATAHGCSTELVNVENNQSLTAPDLHSVTVPRQVTSYGNRFEAAYRIILAEGVTKQFLVFRTRVDDTIATARNLAHVLPADPVPQEVRQRINGLEQTRARDFLSQWVDKRV